ncbi:hypothetical protein AaE_010306 [Aphanomyces astaci]|uniref:Uncharacterized protein n=1 Tax=Aphanomyces astaci TaxID=112090 RepID=A0A6A5A4M8_APHAT|nr:hypothetical protein AaE_010306 [Aphanomyces astaci]
MTSGAMLTMPMLLINMGGEMLYVLDQRLKAQNISGDKSVKVLVDVVKTMYNTKFISELFRPHHMYSNVSTRQIFDRLAHSSIMRLNQSSMDKLYGLMRMGFKYNILACSSADQLVQVTMNHLRSIKEIVTTDEATTLIEEAIVLTANVYGTMSHGNFLLLKQNLCRFFQDVRIKVSLFLQSEIQNGDGSFVLRADGPVATGGDIPGTVRSTYLTCDDVCILRSYYNASGDIESEDSIAMDNARGVVPFDDKPILSRDPSLCPFGGNLYDLGDLVFRMQLIEQVLFVGRYVPNAKPGPKSAPKTGEEMAAEAKKGSKGGDNKQPSPPKQWKATAADGLNLLADLLGAKDSSATDAKPWKINLFADDPDDEYALYGNKLSVCDIVSGLDRDSKDDGDDEGEVETITIDALSDRKTTKALLDEFEDDKPQDKKGGDTDDLLSLMDST